MVTIRRARPQDAPAMAQVHVAAWRSAYAGILPDAYLEALSATREAASYERAILARRGGHAGFVAVADAQEDAAQGIIGFATGGLARRPGLAEGEVETLYLLDDFRDRGIGRRLMRASASHLASLGVQSAFAWVLAFAQVPQTILDGLTGLSTNPTVILLLIVGFLLVFGMFVEMVSALIITVPVLFPLGAELGYDPLHFALVIVTTLLIGTVTPPLGILLYICAGIAETSIGNAIRASLPFIVVLVTAAVLVALVPGLSTWLPGTMS